MRECERCGAVLDPQEVCDCRQEETALVLRCVAPPVISENIAAITAYIDDTLHRLSELEPTKEGCATAKALRADLRRRFDALEDQRKAVKNAVMAPYLDAEKAYKEKIATPMTGADAKLKEWIDCYQDAVKAGCREDLQTYFDELCAVLHIDFVTFDQTGVVVDMTTANLKDPKKARNTIHDFLNRIEDDRRIIATMADAAEIMAEYRQSLSLSYAIAAVNDRRKRTEKASQDLDETQQRNARVEENRQAIYVQTPEIIPAEEMYSATFTVTAPLIKLKALKAYLDSNHYTYEEE